MSAGLFDEEDEKDAEEVGDLDKLSVNPPVRRDNKKDEKQRKKEKRRKEEVSFYGPVCSENSTVSLQAPDYRGLWHRWEAFCFCCKAAND